MEVERLLDIGMARQARSKSATGIYHVMLRGNERKPVFLDEEDKQKFVDILLQKKERSASLLYAYCVMDNHVHMVIQEAGQLLDRFMKRIGITYAAYFNKKYNRVGHVFQDRFRSEPIDDEAYLLSVIRYIHKNPFSQACSPAPNYLWSSYPSYIGYKDSLPLLPEMEDILGRFSSDRTSALQRFYEFHLAEEPQCLFLDMPDEADENAEDILKGFLQSRSWSIGDLQKNENQLIVRELIEMLMTRSKTSGRQIAQLTGINREKMRKMIVSLEPSPDTRDINCLQNAVILGGDTVHNVLPTLEDWKLIFKAAEDFKQAACWDWMDENDVFGVKCPETGTIYYCSIMGAGGAHFSIAAYRGTASLNFLLEVMDGKASSEMIYGQNCLMCSFEDRSMLAKEDLQVIKSLGLKFRGRNQWTLFRDYSPGLYPWFINAEQCRILTHILQQALQVSMRCRENKKYVYRRGDKLLVRVLQKDVTEKAVWVDSYLGPEPSEVALTVFRLQDEVLVRKLKNIKSDNSYTVEADILYVPAPVQDEGRPYFPMLCVLLNRETGIVLASEMIKSIESDGHMLLSMMLETILDSGHKPTAVYVSKPEIRVLFEGLCEQIGVPLHSAPQSKSMHEFRAGMEEHFRSR